MRRFFALINLVVLSLTLGACAPTINTSYFQADVNAPYTLASGDRVRIIVYGQDSLSNSYDIDGSGNISMPLIGIVRAQGDTTASLAQMIEARLANGYIRDPRVSIEVEAFRPFFVLGEVTTPGQYPYVNGMTAQTAVAIAGGFTPRAYKDSIDLTRTVDGHPVTATVPILQLVRPGDTIVVRERYF